MRSHAERGNEGIIVALVETDRIMGEIDNIDFPK